MRLMELFERAAGPTVGLIFGRFNPPHSGHRAAWEMMQRETDHWIIGTNPSTQGHKDPLPLDVKIDAIEAVFPAARDRIETSQSWLTLASSIYERWPDARLVLYTDEAWVVKTVNQYNGVEGKAHGFYNFESIQHQATPRISSATALRDAVRQGDQDEFYRAAGVSSDTQVAGQPYFDVVAHYLGQHPEPKPKAKKAAREEAAGVGIVTKQNATADVRVGGEYDNVRKMFPGRKPKRIKNESQQCNMITMQDIRELERTFDAKLDDFGMDLRFTRHFADRAGDDRNHPCIDVKEIEALLNRVIMSKRAGRKVFSRWRDLEMVLKDVKNNINIPFVINYDPRAKRFDVVAKTIMRKKNFKTSSPEVKV